MINSSHRRSKRLITRTSPPLRRVRTECGSFRASKSRTCSKELPVPHNLFGRHFLLDQPHRIGRSEEDTSPSSSSPTNRVRVDDEIGSVISFLPAKGILSTMSSCGVVFQSRGKIDEGRVAKIYLIQEYYDDKWKALGRYLETGQIGDISITAQRKLRAKALYYFVRNGKLYRRVKNEMPREVVGTKERRIRILQEAHIDGGHKGALSLRYRVALRFFWPGMSEDADDYVRSCDLCQRRDPRQFEEENRSTYPSDLGNVWGIDLVTMPPASGYRYIVIAREDLTKWVEAKAIRKKEASQVAKFLMERIITPYGSIGMLKSDQGSEFMGEVMRTLERFKIKHIRTSPYHLRANGVVERGNGPFKESLYRASRELKRSWNELVDFASWAERTTHSRTTGYTPYRLMMG